MKKWDDMTAVERDELIAEKIMGWHKHNNRWYKSPDLGEVIPFNLPSFSTDQTLAFEILEKFNSYQVTKMFPPKYRTIIEANINCAYSENMMESICKASLIARDVRV